MKNKNIISPVVEQIDTKGTTHIQTTKTNYYDWGNNIIEPITIQTKQGTNPIFETRINYVFNTKGNVVSAYKENDIRTSYIWGYNDTYPIAKAVNAKHTDLIHTSFEDANGVYDSNCKTGRKVRKTAFYYSIGGLSNGSYILTYWKRSGGIWSLQTVSITKDSGSAPNRYIQASSVNPIDEVRLYPAMSLMTTYTYDPLIGMTSSTDENNKTTYFEYDTFGRLKNIQDQDLLKMQEYIYHYKQQ